MSTTTQKVGWFDGDSITVTIELGQDTHNTYAGRADTVDHNGVTEEPLHLSITGVTAQWGCGQITDVLLRLQRLAPGWTVGDVMSLHAIWTRWHLNTMNAACSHMPEDARARWDRRETVECSEGSGYTYGRAWLVEYLPEDVIAEVERLQAIGKEA